MVHTAQLANTDENLRKRTGRTAGTSHGLCADAVERPQPELRVWPLLLNFGDCRVHSVHPPMHSLFRQRRGCSPRVLRVLPAPKREIPHPAEPITGSHLDLLLRQIK